MRKVLTVFLTVVCILTMSLGTALNVWAAETGKVTKIYGTETEAFGCKGFTEFYEGSFFVWFQMDTTIDSTAGYAAINQQVLGDAKIKNSVNSKLKLGGLTVKQVNAADGNPYAAMVAFEDNGSGKLRLSVWLSWGGGTVQSLFQKEVKDKFTVEILSGLTVPTKNYTLTAPEYATIEPVKYEVSIADLEFGQDKSNSKYTADKDSWVKPMFEQLKAQWALPGAASQTSDKPAAGNSGQTSTDKTSTDNENTPAKNNQTSANNTQTKPGDAASTDSPSQTGENTDKPAGNSDTNTDGTAPADNSSQAAGNGDSSSQPTENTGNTSQTDEKVEDSSQTAENSGTSPDATQSEPESNQEKNSFPVLPLILGIAGIAIVAAGAVLVVRNNKKGLKQ